MSANQDAIFATFCKFWRKKCYLFAVGSFLTSFTAL